MKQLILTSCIVALVALAPGCGPVCQDDRCSLSPTKSQVQRVDYVNKPDAGVAPVVSAPSDAGVIAAPADAKPGSAAVGSAAPPGPGSGSATVPAPALATDWMVLDGDKARMTLVSKPGLPVGTRMKVEFIRVPDKTPFVISVAIRLSGGSSEPEASWNDCPDGKLRCDVGTKIHVTKHAGQISLQAGVNWAITDVTTQGASTTLVTWTNNLSRELVTVRLSR